MLGGRISTPPPPPETVFDPDAIPLHVVAIVEINYLPPAQRLKAFEQMGKAAPFKHKWGSSFLVGKLGIITATLIKVDNKYLPSVATRFAARFNPSKPDTRPNSNEKFTAEQLAEVADWALAHGLVGQGRGDKEDRVQQVMDRLAEVNPQYPAVAAFQKIKAELARPVSYTDVSAPLRHRLLEGYKPADGLHYVLVHDLPGGGDIPEVRSRLDRLEETFRSFYYWFALRGTKLDLPKERLVAVLTDKEKDFDRLYEVLTAGLAVAGSTAEAGRDGPLGSSSLGAKGFRPLVVSDGFYGRRNNVVVFSSHRLDDAFDALEKHSTPTGRATSATKSCAAARQAIPATPRKRKSPRP